MVGEVPVANSNLVYLILVVLALGEVLTYLRHLGEGLVVDVDAYIEVRVVDVAHAQSYAALNQDIAVEA